MDEFYHKWDNIGLLNNIDRFDDKYTCAYYLELTYRYFEDMHFLHRINYRLDLIFPFIRRMYSIDNNIEIDKLLEFCKVNLSNYNMDKYVYNYDKSDSGIDDYDVAFLLEMIEAYRLQYNI